MKAIKLFCLILFFGSCGFFKDYTKDNQWSYFEEWDTQTDSKIDKNEFVAGCVRDGFVEKNNTAAADPMFARADENQDGFLSGLEFYRWKIKM